MIQCVFMLKDSACLGQGRMGQAAGLGDSWDGEMGRMGQCNNYLGKPVLGFIRRNKGSCCLDPDKKHNFKDRG